MKCPKCARKVEAFAHFCAQCGEQLSLSPADLTQTAVSGIQDLKPGDLFAERYEILKELGRGGMGIVFKAEDTKLKRSIALKLLPLGLMHVADVKTRFLREAQAAAGLDHPNICTVYESDESEGRPYISMALIEGQELSRLIEKGSLSAEKTLDITMQIASGLEAAHRREIVHRDIKSSNIMITPQDRVKIMDFGIAKVAGATLLTQEGATMGTVAYMSPEQARGESIDKRTDLWSLGVILYQMLSGRLPFLGETAQAVIYAILNEPPLPLVPSDELSAELGKVLLKALSKDMRSRYASAQDLLTDLSTLRSGVPLKEIATSHGIPNSIAVLDFTNITRSLDCDWLSGGIAETVTVDLKRIAALQVFSREKVLKTLGQFTQVTLAEQDIVCAGKKLGIRYLIWGGFQKMGDSVRITAQLTDINSGQLLGSAKVDGFMQDIFKLQDEIIIQLTDFLELDVSDTEKAKIESPETLEIEAYECYAKGRQLQIQMGREGMAKAWEFYEKAIEIDPEYALAYSGLGGLFTLKYISSSQKNDLELGIKYLQKASKLDPGLSDPYLWLTYGYTRESRFDDAIRSGKRAVELETDNPLAHYFLGVAYNVQAALAYQREGYPKALDHYRISLRLAPKYEPALMNSAWIYLLHGRYEQAYHLLEQAVALEESGKGEMVRFVGSLTLMGNLFLRRSDIRKAGDWYRRSLKILEKTDHVYTPAFLALSYIGLGRIQFSQWKYDLALDNYKKARTAIDKGSSALGMGYIMIQALLGMAKAFHGLGLTQEAKQHFHTALGLIAKKKTYDFSWIWEGCDAQAYYEIASFSALLNHLNETLEYLEKAVACGWADWPALDHDSSFERMRQDPDFQQKIQDWSRSPDLLEGYLS